MRDQDRDPWTVGERINSMTFSSCAKNFTGKSTESMTFQFLDLVPTMLVLCPVHPQPRTATLSETLLA